MMPDNIPPKEAEEDELQRLAEIAYINKGKRVSKPDNPEDANPDSAEKYFRPLGHFREQFFFMTTRGRQVLHFPVSKLSLKPVLFMLAPLQWWEREFLSDSGFKGAAVDMAVNWLVSQCFSRGVFRMDRLRGRGAWWDDGRSVIHVGDHLLVDGERCEMNDIESRFVYEALPALLVDLNGATDNIDAKQFLDLCDMLNWENPLYGKLLAGWVVAALVCGAMEWRPHIMLTGPSGCGKSWVGEHMIQRMLGDFVVAAKGETTEAGLRQALQHDALPVTFDEAEGEDQRTVANMDRVLGLMRQASAEVGGNILKGGAEGTAQSYSIRSQFCLIAIRVPLQQTADESRVTILSLKRNTDADKQRFNDEIEPVIEKLEESDFAHRLRARVFRHLHVLRYNARVFAKAFGSHFGNQRIGDQYGPLMAGAWLLGTTEKISLEKAAIKVRQFDPLLGDIREVQSETDEDKLIATLMAQQIDVSGDKKSYKRSIGELIEICAGQRQDVVWTSVASETLERHGIRCAGTLVYVANKHDSLRKLLEKTPWSVGWGYILRRISGAEPSKHTQRFAGVVARCTVIPLSVFVAEGVQNG